MTSDQSEAAKSVLNAHNKSLLHTFGGSSMGTHYLGKHLRIWLLGFIKITRVMLKHGGEKPHLCHAHNNDRETDRQKLPFSSLVGGFALIKISMTMSALSFTETEGS